MTNSATLYHKFFYSALQRKMSRVKSFLIWMCPFIFVLPSYSVVAICCLQCWLRGFFPSEKVSLYYRELSMLFWCPWGEVQLYIMARNSGQNGRIWARAAVCGFLHNNRETNGEAIVLWGGWLCEICLLSNMLEMPSMLPVLPKKEKVLSKIWQFHHRVSTFCCFLQCTYMWLYKHSQ